MRSDNLLIRAGQFNQLARQGAYIVIALALPRLGLTAGQIGEWEALLYLGYVLGFGWTTGLLQGFLVRMGVVPEQLRETFVRRAVGAMAAASLLLLAVVALFHETVFGALQFTRAPTGWPFFLALLLARWPGFCLEQALLLTGRVRALLVYAVLNFCGLAGALLLPLYLGYELYAALACLGAFAGAKGIGVLVLTYKMKGAGGIGLRPWLRASRPLVAYASVAALITAIDPWIVNYWYAGDEATFAMFRYGVRELPLVAGLISGMTAVAIPTIARERAAGLELLRGQSRRLFHIVFGLALLMMLTADYWWTWVFTDTFADSLPIFRIYLLVVGCRMVFAMTVLTALDETRHLYLLSLLELVVNVVLSLALAPAYGLLGIVWGTVAASYFHELCLVVYLRRRRGVGWATYGDLWWYVGYLALLGGAYLLV